MTQEIKLENRQDDWQEAFNEWMIQVDKELMKLTDGLIHLDFADWPYADAFDSGVEPADVAQEVLEDNGFPSEE